MKRLKGKYPVSEEEPKEPREPRDRPDPSEGGDIAKPNPPESNLLAEIHALREAIERLEDKMADELKTLQAAVAANTTVIGSAITLIEGIKAALDAAIAANDPVALQALSDTLDTESTRLAKAVAANTPSS